MKNSVIVGTVCLLLGCAVGWVARQGSQGSSAATAGGSGRPASGAGAGGERPTAGAATKTDRPRDDGPAGSVARGAVVRDGEVTDADESPADVREARNQWRKPMLDRQRKRFDAQVAKLVADLGLDSSQEARLRELFDKRFEALDERMVASNEGNFLVAKEIAGLMRGDGLEEELAGVLTADQQQAYAEMKLRERENNIDSRALKDLARVNEVVDLREDQKQAVYERLYEDAAQAVDANSDANTFMAVLTERMGMEFDSDNLGISEAIQQQMEAAAAGEPMDDPRAWMMSVRESLSQRIDDKVERLRPVLDDQQLDQYRSHLEAKSTGLFGGMLGGAETEATIEGR